MSTPLFDEVAGSAAAGTPEPRISLIWIQATNWGRMVPVPQPLQEPTGWVVDRVKHLVARVNARYRLRGAQHVGRVYAYGALRVHNQGTMTVGDQVLFQGGPYRTEIRCLPGGRVEIADGARFNYGVLIEAAHSVQIGPGCEVASRCTLVDHSSAAGQDDGGPIVLEPNVWLAHGVTVMPGVRIGRGSVVSAGSVVTSDVPEGSMIIGRPGRRIALRSVAR